ncbi:Trm112 family protein [Nocardioides sp. CCNWLW239]|uniref:Trm112 family protein n=1 Tax=Nocardioides sp. CCNWLW239 TaxID=3128902 RepID=UPI003016580D
MNGATTPLGLSEKLLEIIVCPQCHGDLLPVEATAPDQTAPGQTAPDQQGELVCQGECGLAYPVRDGIPVLLIDEARPTNDK